MIIFMCHVKKEDDFDDLKTFVINFLTTANWCVSAVRSVI